MLIGDESTIGVKSTTFGRFYFRLSDPDDLYPSVTTVLSNPAGKAKRGGSPSQVLGTLAHYNILNKYKRLERPTERIFGIPHQEAQDRLTRCVSMWNGLKLCITPVAVEAIVFNERPKYAGRIDLLGNVGNKLVLLDLKTGCEYPGHNIQGSAYWNALDRVPQEVSFVYLDGIVDRNPEQKAWVRTYEKDQLEEYYATFLDRYINFCWPKQK
jgi:hypothetical protein